MADRTVSVRLQAITSDFTAGMARAATATGALASKTASFTRSHRQEMDMVGKAALGLGAATLTGAGLAGKAAMDFESSFAGVRKTVDATEAEFDALSTGFRRMATEIPVTVNEINAIGEAAGQLGIEMHNIEDFTRVMADLGVATNMASDEAATSLARLANITQMPQTEFDRLGSTVVDLGNNLATTESEIVEMGLRLAGAGAQVGLAESEILGLAGSLSSVGINAEAGGSAISRVMIEIASQVETSGELLGEFASVAGMSAEDFSTAWRDDAAMALVAFVEGLGSMEEQGGSTLQTLENLEITEIRMRDALLRASGAGDLMRESLEGGNRAWEENNALTAEAAQRYETAESRVQIAKNQLYDFAIDVGAGVLPVMVTLAETAGDVAGAVGGLPEPLKAAGGTAMVAVGGMATLGGGLLLLAPRIVATKDALAAMNVTLATTRARLASTARFMVGPWGVAIASAGSALAVFNRQQQDARAFAEDLHDELAEAPGDLSRVSDEMLTNTLRTKDVMGAWRDTGLELDVLRRAMQGSAEDAALIESHFDTLLNPIDALKTAIPGLRDEQRDLAHTIADLLSGTRDYTDQVEQQQQATEGGAAAIKTLTGGVGGWLDEIRGAAHITDTLTGGMGGWIDRLREYGEVSDGTSDSVAGMSGPTNQAAEAFEALGLELDEAATTGETLLAIMQQLAGGTLNLDAAAIGYVETVESLIESLGENGATLDIHTEKGRTNLSAVLDVVDATHRHVEALADSGATMGDIRGTIEQHVDQLGGVMRQAGMTDEQINGLIQRYGLVPDQVITHMEASGVDVALGEVEILRRQLEMLAGRNWVFNVRAKLAGAASTPGVPTGHSGGMVSSLPLTTGPLHGDELMVKARHGERILTPEQNVQWERMTMVPAAPSFVGGGTSDRSRHVKLTINYPHREPPSKTLAAAHAELYLAGD